MLSISKQQAGQRWDIITPQLREALFSDVNADFVWNLCQNEHLTEEKSYQVAEISGYVLLGFLHPEDLAGELVDSVDLPAPLAKTISDQINSRVFAPLRTDIDKVYSPLSKLGVPSISIGSAPKILQDIGASQNPNTVSNVASATTTKPMTLSDIGWSKQPTAGPSVSAGVAIPTPTPASPRQAIAPAIPKPVVTTAEPAPIMLHEDTTFKPAEKNVGFTLSKPGGSAEMSISRGTAQAPTRPAVLEFGGSAKSAGTSIPKPPAGPSSSARPMGFGPSFASMPTSNIGARNVSQIMPTVTPATSVPIPKPPTPPTPQKNFAASFISIPTPRPPQVPQPPKPPVPQNIPTASQLSKPIVKDFL